jgi:hypothetical protein
MVRSYPVVTALLVLSIAACDAGGPAAPEALQDDAPLLTLLAEAADVRSTSAGNQLFERLASEIPGFGGLYRTAPCSVAVVLTSAANETEAVGVVHAALTSLVGRRCAANLVVSAVAGSFTYHELQRFLQAVMPFAGSPGVAGVTLSYQQNQIIIAVRNSEVARRLSSALSDAGVPAQAVAFRIVGGRG